MNNELRRAKARADQAWLEAVSASFVNLSSLGVDYRIAQWSNSISDKYIEQWCGEPLRQGRGWDWPTVSRRYRGPKDRTAALLMDDRLVALTQISATRSRVKVQLIEGDSRDDCPLKSKRALIMLDLAATYGQVLGCSEIHLEALNERLKVLYVTTYGFSHAPEKGAPMALRRVLI